MAQAVTGSIIAELRETKGWSQTALAAKAQVRFAVLQRIEAGEAPSTANLHRLARALSVDPAYLRTKEGAQGLEAEPMFRAMMARLDALYAERPATCRKILTIFNQSFILADKTPT